MYLYLPIVYEELVYPLNKSIFKGFKNNVCGSCSHVRTSDCQYEYNQVVGNDNIGYCVNYMLGVT